MIKYLPINDLSPEKNHFIHQIKCVKSNSGVFSKILATIRWLWFTHVLRLWGFSHPADQVANVTVCWDPWFFKGLKKEAWKLGRKPEARVENRKELDSRFFFPFLQKLDESIELFLAENIMEQRTSTVGQSMISILEYKPLWGRGCMAQR